MSDIALSVTDLGDLRATLQSLADVAREHSVTIEAGSVLSHYESGLRFTVGWDDNEGEYGLMTLPYAPSE